MREPYAAGGFLCVVDMQGYRHALRLTSITQVRDASEDQTESLIIVNGGRAAVHVPASFELLLEEIAEAACAAPRGRW